MEHYITKVHIEKIRHLSGIDIEINPAKRSHLLLTGKNGSGKTSVLRAIKQYLKTINDTALVNVEKNYPQLMRNAEKELESATNETDRFRAKKDVDLWKSKVEKYKQGACVEFNSTDGIEGLYKEGNYITAFYSADRRIGITRQDNVENIVLEESYSLDSNPGAVLLKYLVHLKTQQAYARNENDITTVRLLDMWFNRFENALKILLDDQSIVLKYDYKNYVFEIIESGREPFGLDQLSDGYSAVIQIVADIILRMEKNWLKKGELNSYTIEGIVLIDELETHLHIALQKTILPFLTSFFPNIQFIVSTHSPYILNSVDNCVIYDLENQVRIEDMSGYSAEGIVEGYFGFESYSDLLMKKVKRYEELVNLASPTEDEKGERATIAEDLRELSGDLSREAKSAFLEIEDRRRRSLE